MYSLCSLFNQVTILHAMKCRSQNQLKQEANKINANSAILSLPTPQGHIENPCHKISRQISPPRGSTCLHDIFPHNCCTKSRAASTQGYKAWVAVAYPKSQFPLGNEHKMLILLLQRWGFLLVWVFLATVWPLASLALACPRKIIWILIWMDLCSQNFFIWLSLHMGMSL